VHGSLLPKYRGASPLQSVFLNNEQETGITIMRMNAGLDEGDSIEQLIVPLPFDMTVADLIDFFKEKVPSFLNTTLRKY
jgi:methionyl-tRNA formyltransferase